MTDYLTIARKKIDQIDHKMIKLFEQRLEVSRNLGLYKKTRKLSVYNPRRELELLNQNMRKLRNVKENGIYYRKFFNTVLSISKIVQREKITHKCGLLGKNLTHSKSPLIHNVISNLSKRSYSYELIEIEELNDVKPYLKMLKNGEYLGFNVTMPYKNSIIKYCDYLTPISYLTGSVNTLYVKRGKIYGDNTDYYGLKFSINEIPFDLTNHTIHILGTGSTAKTAGYILNEKKVSTKFVSRDATNKKLNFPIINYDELEKENIDIIINATPVGMYPNVNERIIKKDIAKQANYALDMIYNPEKSLLLEDAKAGSNGLHMLIVQALESFKLWFAFQLSVTKSTVEKVKTNYDKLL